MNKIENINLLPDTEPDSGDYTGEDGLLYCGKCRKPKEAYFPEGLLKISIRKKELFYKAIHAKTVVVLYRVILREFLRPAKLPVSSTERISVSRVTIAYMSFKNNALLYEMQKEKPIAPRIWSLFLSSYFSL